MPGEDLHLSVLERFQTHHLPPQEAENPLCLLEGHPNVNRPAKVVRGDSECYIRVNACGRRESRNR